MSYVNRNLNPGETVVHRTRLHWLIFLWPTVLFGLAAGVWTIESWSRWALVPFGLGLIWFVKEWIRYTTHEFAVTTSRVILKAGLLSRTTVEIQLGKAEALSVIQTIAGRMFNYGTLEIGGTGGTKRSFGLIAAPIEFRRRIQAQEETRIYGGAPVGAGPERVERDCPYCAERILVRATRCRHCGQPV